MEVCALPRTRLHGPAGSSKSNLQVYIDRCVGELARAGWFFKEHLACIGSSIAVVLPRMQRLVPSLPLELSFTTRYLVIPMVVIAACTERKARVGSFAAAQVASKTSPKEEVIYVNPYHIYIAVPRAQKPPGENRCSMFCATPSLQPRAVGLGGRLCRWIIRKGIRTHKNKARCRKAFSCA